MLDLYFNTFSTAELAAFKAEFKEDIISEKDCYISSMNAEEIGVASVILGAGREKKEDAIDFSAGIVLNKKSGNKVAKGDTIATLYTNNKDSLKTAKENGRHHQEP